VTFPAVQKVGVYSRDRVTGALTVLTQITYTTETRKLTFPPILFSLFLRSTHSFPPSLSRLYPRHTKFLALSDFSSLALSLLIGGDQRQSTSLCACFWFTLFLLSRFCWVSNSNRLFCCTQCSQYVFFFFSFFLLLLGFGVQFLSDIIPSFQPVRRVSC
jgi:hypothetical protein